MIYDHRSIFFIDHSFEGLGRHIIPVFSAVFFYKKSEIFSFRAIIIIFIYDSLTYDRSMHFGQYGWKNLFLFFVVVIFRFRHEPFGSQYNNTSGKGTFFTECPRIFVQVL